MSRWRTYYEQGEAVFQPWFDQNMSRLYEIIESEESRDFAGQIQTIREKLYVNYDTSKQNDLLRRLFVGREWLTAQLEQWMDDPDGVRLCVLYGDPGVGKSAFAANFIHYNPRVAAGLFCEYDRPHYNDARTVTMTQAYLLACRLPSYRVVLSDILEHEKRLDQLNAPEPFDLLLSDPLSHLVIDGGHETLCIVIDGLDECAQGERNVLAERSGGIFLYAQLVAGGILAGKMSVRDMTGFPDGLSGAFCQWLGWFFPDDGAYKDFRLPLGMLLAAPELPTEELKRLFGWDGNEVEDFLRRVEVLLRRGMNVFRKETVSFSHPYIAQWLDSREAGRFQSSNAYLILRLILQILSYIMLIVIKMCKQEEKIYEREPEKRISAGACPDGGRFYPGTAV